MDKLETIHYIVKNAVRISHEEDITKSHAVEIIDRWYKQDSPFWDEIIKLTFQFYYKK